MNDDVRFERLFADGLHELAPRRAPDQLRTKVKTETDEVRPRARWLALVKEPPMRTNSRLAVGSPIARAAAIMAATLMAALFVVSASLAGAQLLAADGPIVVDQDGNGDFDTITEAVAEAHDGDEILVKPGTYTEAVVIDKDIALSGDGPVADIVIVAPEDGPKAQTHMGLPGEPYAVLLAESSGSVSGLTFRGEPSVLIVSGGSPTVKDNVLDSVGWPFPTRGFAQDGSSIVTNAGSTAHLIGNTFIDGGPIGVFGLASPVIEANHLEGGPHIYLAEPGPDTIVRGNEITATLDRAIGMSGPGTILIEDNHISNAGAQGIRVGRNAGAEGFEPLVRNNTVERSATGIMVTQGGTPQIEGNTLIDNGTGVRLSNASGAYVGNVIKGGQRGLVVTGGSPTIVGNTICDNEVNVIDLESALPPEYADANEICEDAAAA